MTESNVTVVNTKALYDKVKELHPNEYIPYYCIKCGKEARWNTPALDDQGNIYCPNCADKSKALLVGVDQHTLEPNGTWYKDGGVVWFENGEISCAWLEGGSQSVPVHFGEKIMPPEAFLDMILHERDSGKFRCSSCADTFYLPPAGRPLFAGINCPKCWEKHLEYVEKERKSGRVCSLCHQPYSNCCC